MVDTDGLVDASYRGYGGGQGPGEPQGTGESGTCGASHGGLGGHGSLITDPNSAYGDVLMPSDYGSGGNTVSVSTIWYMPAV